MNNSPPLNQTKNPAALFEQLNQQDVEEFYLGYQYWQLQYQIKTLQNQLNQVRRKMIENTERIQQVQPTAIELATLARLQSNGVSDVDLLDRMLERGEVWLDRTMQRLDYLEQLDDFIRDDYTQWCNHALDGAYDWIDSVVDSNSATTDTSDTTDTTDTSDTSTNTQDNTKEVLIEATEELFLQKISVEDELQSDVITSKRPSITATDVEEVVPPSEDAIPADYLEETQGENAVSEERPFIENSQSSTQEPSSVHEPIEIEAVVQTPSRLSTYVPQVSSSTNRPGFMKRFLGKIWGS